MIIKLSYVYVLPPESKQKQKAPLHDIFVPILGKEFIVKAFLWHPLDKVREGESGYVGLDDITKLVKTKITDELEHGRSLNIGSGHLLDLPEYYQADWSDKISLIYHQDDREFLEGQLPDYLGPDEECVCSVEFEIEVE